MLGIRSDRWIAFFAMAALVGLLLPLAPAPAAMMRIPATVLFVAGFAGILVAGAYAWHYDTQARRALEHAGSALRGHAQSVVVLVGGLRQAATRSVRRVRASLTDLRRDPGRDAIRDFASSWTEPRLNPPS